MLPLLHSLVQVIPNHSMTQSSAGRYSQQSLICAQVINRSALVGPFHHNDSSSPIAKVDWHPWGGHASTLLVLSVDGFIR